MQGRSTGGIRAPVRLLHLCKDLDLIEDYAITDTHVMITQGRQTRLYSPAEAEAFLDTMLDAAPMLKRIAADLPRIYRSSPGAQS